MRTTLARLRRVLAAAVLALSSGAVVVAKAPLSRADDASPAPVAQGDSAAARLSPDEVAALRRRFPAWDTLDSAMRERVAKNVLRWRALSAEQRAVLVERARRAQAIGDGVLEELPRRMSAFGRLDPDGRSRVRESGRALRIVAAAVVRSLPPEAQALFNPNSGPDSLTFGERLLVDKAIAAHWRKLELARDGEAEVSPNAPPDSRARIEHLREEIRQGGGRRPELRAELLRLLLQERFRAAFNGVPPPGPGANKGAVESALVESVKTRFPETFAAVSSEVAAAAGKGRAGLLDYARAHDLDASLGRERALLETLLTIERVRNDLRDEALSRASAFQVDLLRVLVLASNGRVSAADADAFATLSPAERLAFLQRLKKELGGGPGPFGPRPERAAQNGPPGGGPGK